MKLPESDHNLDKPLLRNINDRANGGFIIFSFGEDGYPIVNSHFNDASKAMALQHYIQNWSLAVDAVTLENTVASMEMELEEDIPLPPEGESEDGDDDEFDESP